MRRSLLYKRWLLIASGSDLVVDGRSVVVGGQQSMPCLMGRELTFLPACGPLPPGLKPQAYLST